MKKTLFLLPLMAILFSCTHKVAETPTAQEPASVPASVIRVAPGQRATGSVNAYPKATAFRMNGDYSDNVAVTIGADGSLTYFPAPSDITGASRPISLGNGWWLNCQGVSDNSVFTTYTFAEYAALKEVPSPETLLKAVIPGSAVTQIMQLPFPLGEARQNLEKAKEFLKENGLPSIKVNEQ